MDPNELIDLLDLKSTRAGPATDPALVVSADGGKPESLQSPTALVVDAWGLRRGRELLAASERLERLGLDEFAIADCHAAAFDPEPILCGGCREQARREFFATLLETPEYRALHQSTRLDANASEIAAAHFAEALNRYREDADSKGDAAGKDADSTMSREIAALRAISSALAAASAEVSECHEAVAAFGLGAGCPGANDVQAVANLFRRVRNDPALRSICTLAGRYRRLAQSRQRRKVRHGLDDMVGIELGGDLGRVLPHELAKLATPPMDLEALRRLAERQLMCREYQSVEPVGRGPVVVCLDESGSMDGEPIHAAKAIALALAWIAKSQRRWSALVAYSGDSGERILPLPPGRWDERALADWLTQFIGRGSTLDVPVREMPRIFADLKAPVGDTDVIFVTDCQCRIPETVRDAFHAWKRSARARLITLVIGGDAGDLRALSDETHLVRSLGIRENGVSRVLSI
jgi:uncharacterized protein with von Willebrand factor type A (vWA) domain